MATILRSISDSVKIRYKRVLVTTSIFEAWSTFLPIDRTYLTWVRYPCKRLIVGRVQCIHRSYIRLRYYSRTGLLLHNHFSWLMLTRLEVPWNPPPPPLHPTPPHNTTDSSISWYESSGARSRVTRPFWSRSSSQRQPITTSRIKKCVVRTAVRRRRDIRQSQQLAESGLQLLDYVFILATEIRSLTFLTERYHWKPGVSLFEKY